MFFRNFWCLKTIYFVIYFNLALFRNQLMVRLCCFMRRLHYHFRFKYINSWAHNSIWEKYRIIEVVCLTIRWLLGIGIELFSLININIFNKIGCLEARDASFNLVTQSTAPYNKIPTIKSPEKFAKTAFTA